jgi:hypothetical protein
LWIANVEVSIHPESGNAINASFCSDVVNPISRREALEIARKCILDNGWRRREVCVFKDEFNAEKGSRINCWTITTNRNALGGNATIILDTETGKVLEASFISR